MESLYHPVTIVESDRLSDLDKTLLVQRMLKDREFGMRLQTDVKLLVFEDALLYCKNKDTMNRVVFDPENDSNHHEVYLGLKNRVAFAKEQKRVWKYNMDLLKTYEEKNRIARAVNRELGTILLFLQAFEDTSELLADLIDDVCGCIEIEIDIGPAPTSNGSNGAVEIPMD